MGPTLLLDKCAFQSLSRNELYAVSRCFFINLPPILTLEILGDLKKSKGLIKATPQEEVQLLSDKLLVLFEAHDNAHYRLIAEGETQGYYVELRGVAVLAGGKRKQLPDGSFGVIFDEHPNRERLRRWAAGEFTPDDEAHAQQWREQSQKVNIEQIRTELLRKAKGLPRPATLSDAACRVDEQMAKAPPFGLLLTLLDFLRLKNSLRDRAIARWRQLMPRSFREFAPYGNHLLRTMHLYTLGLAYGLVGARPTNILDLEYLFYLPFCRVFSSGDKFVADMAAALLMHGQVFLEREALKRDMLAVHEYYQCETEAQKPLEEKYDSEQSVFTHALWKINEPPWKRKTRNLAPEMSEEAKKRLLARVKALTT